VDASCGPAHFCAIHVCKISLFERDEKGEEEIESRGDNFGDINLLTRMRAPCQGNAF
jgi:hypothetical protein